jgi:adenosylcobinamide kinase/adenosylcobinamide-phosphate guanylyltransferase
VSKRIVLFTGGARSGKSTCAERYAALEGKPVVYLATAEAGDDEMRERISLHRQRRPGEWRTLEVPRHIGPTLRSIEPGTVVLLDCLTLLVSNVLLAHEAAPEQALEGEMSDLLAATHERELILIVVTNEVGMGLVPEYPLGRRYRDLLGRAAQRIAAAADEVYLVVAGIVVDLRRFEAAWAKEAMR